MVLRSCQRLSVVQSLKCRSEAYLETGGSVQKTSIVNHDCERVWRVVVSEEQRVLPGGIVLSKPWPFEARQLRGAP
jgi:hypothetical protein